MFFRQFGIFEDYMMMKKIYEDTYVQETSINTQNFFILKASFDPPKCLTIGQFLYE